MTPSEIATGHNRAWILTEKLGEGDAGEVYRVESLLDHHSAILKRPRRGAFGSEIIRQANQIEREGEALLVLARLEHPGIPIHTPLLVDHGKTGTKLTENYFIVITEAPGIDLIALVRLFQTRDLIELQNAGAPWDFLFTGSSIEQVPTIPLVRILFHVLSFLEYIHSYRFSSHSNRYSGLIWNDVKPEHIFWDLPSQKITLIDWGNAQFLEADGATRDRRYSRMNDYHQFLAEMGRFLLNVSPELRNKLAWPDIPASETIYSSRIIPLKANLAAFVDAAQDSIHHARNQERDLLQKPNPEMDDLQELIQLHRTIVTLGEHPDLAGAKQFIKALAHTLIESQRYTEFQSLCNTAFQYWNDQPENCRLIKTISTQVTSGNIPAKALTYLLSDDMASALWEIVSIQQTIDEGWYDEIIREICQLAIGSHVTFPYIAVNRLLHAVQSNAQLDINNSNLVLLQKTLQEEILPRWLEYEPDPPDADLAYSDISRLSEKISEALPEISLSLSASLNQPMARVQLVLDAWERLDLDAARRALRQLLLCDPHRKRVLLADEIFKQVPIWLSEVRSGPQKDELLQDFITKQELIGREIRNRIGPASWLDNLLNAFRNLRKGVDPIEVLSEFPQTRNDLAWLLILEPRRPILSASRQPLKLERQIIEETQRPTLYGQKEVSLGKDREFILYDSLDTWTPEAIGSSARVFSGELSSLTGEKRQAAIKLMRTDIANYALPLFREEVRILTMLRDVPGVNQMIECGFIHLDAGLSIPKEERSASASHLTGFVQRYGPDSVHNFLIDLDNKISQDFIPYIAVEAQNRTNNLLLLCDTSYTHGKFLPTLDGLRLSIQICDILAIAHDRNITYRDHKILHYYWQEKINGIYLIDWNIARRFPEGLSVTDIQFDLVQFAARAMHYILTGRPAPGALPLGANRPEEIESAARSYSTHWTYDDQRLPKEVKDLLDRSLAGEYEDARKLQEDLLATFHRLSKLID